MINEIASEVNLSQGTVHSILHDSLNINPYQLLELEESTCHLLLSRVDPIDQWKV